MSQRAIVALFFLGVSQFAHGFPAENEALSPCANTICMNGGTCIPLSGTYFCNCQAPFVGKNCEKTLHACSNNPCKNGGTCLIRSHGYSCECLLVYFGKDCEKKDCYTGTGSDYRGFVSFTNSGFDCQPWSKSISPHNNPRKKPNAGLVENYCRNPDNGDRPWCYKKKSLGHKKSWEYCPVPKC